MAKLSSEKMDVVITVAPERAVLAMGLLSGFLDGFWDYVQDEMADPEMPFDDSIKDDMHSIIGEVFDKCIAQTNIPERVQNMIELEELTGGMMPSLEEN